MLVQAICVLTNLGSLLQEAHVDLRLEGLCLLGKGFHVEVQIASFPCHGCHASRYKLEAWYL